MLPPVIDLSNILNDDLLCGKLSLCDGTTSTSFVMSTNCACIRKNTCDQRLWINAMIHQPRRYLYVLLSIVVILAYLDPICQTTFLLYREKSYFR
jgi:hypothetical protein